MTFLAVWHSYRNPFQQFLSLLTFEHFLSFVFLEWKFKSLWIFYDLHNFLPLLLRVLYKVFSFFYISSILVIKFIDNIYFHNVIKRTCTFAITYLLKKNSNMRSLFFLKYLKHFQVLLFFHLCKNVFFSRILPFVYMMVYIYIFIKVQYAKTTLLFYYYFYSVRHTVTHWKCFQRTWTFA